MNCKLESCRNESEVISRLIVGHLLPQLGYFPVHWFEKIEAADKHLRLFKRAVPLMSFVLETFRITAPAMTYALNRVNTADIVLDVRHPGERLDVDHCKLRSELEQHNARYGLLTNGRELKIYEKASARDLRLIFECPGEKIADKIHDICTALGRNREHTKKTPSADVEKDRETCKVIEKQPSVSAVSPSPAVSPVTLPASSRQKAATDRNKTDSNRKVSPMKVIAIYHNKGGVGKTTISVNLAASFARKGKNVLLIDMDAQANTTLATGLITFQFEEDDTIRNNYVYHLLESGETGLISDIVQTSCNFNTPEVHVIPSHINLIDHQDKLNKIAVSRSRLPAKLERVKDVYDIVIIDTPPSRDLYAEIPLISADYLIIPSDLKPFANQGLNNVKQFVRQVNEYREVIGRNPLELLGVLPSKISTNAQFLKYTFPRQKSVVPERYDLPLMESIIFERTPLSNCLNHTRLENDMDVPAPQSIFKFREHHSNASVRQAAQDFEALTLEVLEHIQSK